MTLHDFLESTATVPAPTLRQAEVQALAVEPARTPEARRWFYVRVTAQLGVSGAGTWVLQCEI